MQYKRRRILSPFDENMSTTINHAAAGSYSESGFSQRMGWGSRPALIIIDVCKAYFTEQSPLSLLSNPAGAAAPDSMRRLLSAARSGGVPVIWSQIEYVRPDMSDAGLFWHKAKMLDVWLKDDPRGLWQCVPGLEPEEDEVVVVKKYPSAFFGTSLATELQVNHCRSATGSEVGTDKGSVSECRYAGDMWCEYIWLCESDYARRYAVRV